LPRGASLVRPWFSVSTSWTSNSTGAVALTIATGLSMGTVTVSATQGARRVTLNVTRRGSSEFVATGQLTSGRWTTTIVYGTPAIDGPRASSTESLRVP
jgi:hypothetical protein